MSISLLPSGIEICHLGITERRDLVRRAEASIVGAGCISYVVWVQRRHVYYLRRNDERHCATLNRSVSV
nr:hypothetical protein [uncultured Undibacterium sp.]